MSGVHKCDLIKFSYICMLSFGYGLLFEQIVISYVFGYDTGYVFI